MMNCLTHIFQLLGHGHILNCTSFTQFKHTCILFRSGGQPFYHRGLKKCCDLSRGPHHNSTKVHMMFINIIFFSGGGGGYSNMKVTVCILENENRGQFRISLKKGYWLWDQKKNQDLFGVNWVKFE